MQTTIPTKLYLVSNQTPYDHYHLSEPGFEETPVEELQSLAEEWEEVLCDGILIP